MLDPDSNKNAEDESPTVRLPETHTALLAPIGYPVEATCGVESAKPSMPPRDADDQVAWSEKQPATRTLDNRSLVDEYVQLVGLEEDGYIAPLSPAGWRYHEMVSPALSGRVNALNKMVEQLHLVRRFLRPRSEEHEQGRMGGERKCSFL